MLYLEHSVLVVAFISLKFKINNHYLQNKMLGVYRGSHRLEKYLNLEGFLEKSLKIKYALKRTGTSFKGLEKSLNSSIFCRN